MSLPVVYLPEAEDDVDAVYQYYEEQRTGLGDEFLSRLREAVDRIREHPKSYAVWRRGIRAIALRQFPYVIYDRDIDVLVIAVQHGRRSHRAWRGRG